MHPTVLRYTWGISLVSYTCINIGFRPRVHPDPKTRAAGCRGDSSEPRKYETTPPLPFDWIFFFFQLKKQSEYHTAPSVRHCEPTGFLLISRRFRKILKIITGQMPVLFLSACRTRSVSRFCSRKLGDNLNDLSRGNFKNIGSFVYIVTKWKPTKTILSTINFPTERKTGGGRKSRLRPVASVPFIDRPPLPRPMKPDPGNNRVPSVSRRKYSTEEAVGGGHRWKLKKRRRT